MTFDQDADAGKCFSSDPPFSFTEEQKHPRSFLSVTSLGLSHGAKQYHAIFVFLGHVLC